MAGSGLGDGPNAEADQVKMRHAAAAQGIQSMDSSTVLVKASSNNLNGSSANGQPGALKNQRTESEADMCEAADTDAKLQRMARESAFIDIDHPITVYEAIKLGVMLPVVILKVSKLTSFEDLLSAQLVILN